ncbi:MAG: hypothetical protein R6V47_00440, partial [Candidatus Delongbacteria bacterium]
RGQRRAVQAYPPGVGHVGDQPHAHAAEAVGGDQTLEPLMSPLGAIGFNPFFVWSEKLKARYSKGFFGYINYNYLFKAAVYRSLKKSSV